MLENIEEKDLIEQTDNSVRPEDGEQDVSQDKNIRYDTNSIIDELGRLV